MIICVTLRTQTASNGRLINNIINNEEDFNSKLPDDGDDGHGAELYSEPRHLRASWR